jgi:hypothetical protein
MEMMAFIYSANISTIVSASRIFSVNKYMFLPVAIPCGLCLV